MIEKRIRATVSIGLIRILMTYLDRIECNTMTIFSAAGLEPAILKDDDARITSRQFGIIWTAAARHSNDPSFGLHFGQMMANRIPGGHVLFTIMMNCSTVGQALEKFIFYHRIMADAIQPRLRIGRHRAFLFWDVFASNDTPLPDISEALLCIFKAILDRLIGSRFKPMEVHFTQPPPPNQEDYKTIFQAPLVFEARRNQLVIPNHSLETPILLASDELLQALEKYGAGLLDRLESTAIWSQKVTRLIGQRLIKGQDPGMDVISKELAVSKRNLQLKLQSEQTSFRQLTEKVRKDIACEYLCKDDVTICDVAFMLGYSEQSGFNHAFKRWMGMTPRTYRQSCCNGRAD